MNDPAPGHPPWILGRSASEPDLGTIQEVQVLGPYNSGTNLMFAYQRRLFDLPAAVHRLFGKHSLPPHYRWGGPGCLWSPGAPMPLKKISATTLLICMVRRPYFWALSTSRRSYGIAFLDRRRTFADRIRSRVRFQEVTYPNLIAVWNAYYRAYQRHLEPHQVLYVRLEDLVEEPHRLLASLGRHLPQQTGIDLDRVIEEVAGTPAKRHGGDCVFGEAAKQEYRAEMVARRIEAEDLTWINQHLDHEIRQRFAYPRAAGHGGETLGQGSSGPEPVEQASAGRPLS